MCGIIGVVSKKDKGFNVGHLELFKEMLICDAIRGEDSTGVFSVNESGNSSYLKLATHPFNLLSSKEYREWEQASWANARAVVGHNRKATLGSVTNKNAHPFVHKNIILIHNGNVSNFRGLLHHKKREKIGVEVDSHAAAVIIGENDPVKILPELQGAFTFVWYDVEKKKLNFIRNEERPLYFASSDQYVFFASEGGMLKWLLERRDISVVITALKPNQLVTFNLENEFSWEHRPIEFKKEKTFYPITGPHEPINDGDAHRAAVLYLKNRHKKIDRLKLLPEAKQYNIHYGRNEYIKDGEIEEEQIVFSVNDYKNIGGDENRWIMWGPALDSELLECVFNFEGSREEADKLGYASYLIGFVKRVKNKMVGETRTQEIIVTDVRPVEMTTSPNGVPITKEHWDYLCDTGTCRCKASCSGFQPEDLYIDRPTSLDNNIICQWCVDADKGAEKVINSNETTPDTPLQAGE